MNNHDDPSNLIRRIEKAAWIDMLDAPTIHQKRTFGIAALRTRSAGFLACQGMPAVPFNRIFAQTPDWIFDAEKRAAGIAWMDAHASKGWVMQVDDQTLSRTLGTINQIGFEKTGAGWSKFIKQLPTAVSLDYPSAVRLVKSEQEADDFSSVVIAGFGFPEAMSQWFKAIGLRSNWSCFVAYTSSGPAAAAAMFRTSNGAWFGIDATLQSARRQGLQQSLISARIVHAARQGLSWAMAETSSPASTGGLKDTSYRNYERAGFGFQHESINFWRVPAHCLG